MKKIFVLHLSLIACISLHAQQVVSTSGDQAENSTAQISWTIGEPIIETCNGGGYELTQGFHQSYLTVSAVDEIQMADFEISAFPNPTTETLEIVVKRASNDDLKYQLYDLNGNLLLEEKITDNEATIQTLDLQPATYFIKISEGNKTIQTLKIIKK